MESIMHLMANMEFILTRGSVLGCVRFVMSMVNDSKSQALSYEGLLQVIFRVFV